MKEDHVDTTPVVLWMGHAPLCRRRVFSQLVLSDRSSKLMFWHLLPAPVVGGHQYRVLTFSAEGTDGQDKFFCDSKSEMVQPHGVELNEEGQIHEGRDMETSMGVIRQG